MNSNPRPERIEWILDDLPGSFSEIPVYIAELEDKVESLQGTLDRLRIAYAEMEEEKDKEIASLREDAECANDWEQQLLGCDKELTEANAEMMRLNLKIETVHAKCERALGRLGHETRYRNAILAIAETLRVKEENP